MIEVEQVSIDLSMSADKNSISEYSKCQINQHASSTQFEHSVVGFILIPYALESDNGVRRIQSSGAFIGLSDIV